jgi:hypothetical protein
MADEVHDEEDNCQRQQQVAANDQVKDGPEDNPSDQEYQKQDEENHIALLLVKKHAEGQRRNCFSDLPYGRGPERGCGSDWGGASVRL